MKLIDLTGTKFGHLTVIRRHGDDVRGRPTWLCRCDCGNEIVRGQVRSLIKRGARSSCGCQHYGNNIHGKAKVHGGAKTVEYRAWLNMKKRCSPNAPKLKWRKRYFERGIRVCDEWQTDFLAFYRHMGRRPGPGYSIDRIDNDGNYEPGNVRWATAQEQAQNSFRNPWNKGKTQSEEHRRKIGEANRRRVWTAESRQKISDARKRLAQKRLTLS